MEQVKRAETVRKRPLEPSKSNPADMIPTKVKPCSSTEKKLLNKNMDCTAQFVMDQKVHDVEEHFRRSLQSFQQKQKSSSSFLPVITKGTLSKRGPGDNEPHQILITENSSMQEPMHHQQQLPSPVSSPLSSSSSLSPPFSHTKATLITKDTGGNIPPSIHSPKINHQQVYMSIPTYSTSNTTNNDKFSNNERMTVLTSPSQAGGFVLPAMIPTVASSNFIPVLESTQLITATPPAAIATNPATPLAPGSSPVLYIGPTPMFAPPGVVILNPIDLQKSPVTATLSGGPSPMVIPPPPPSTSTNSVPNYIILPSTFPNASSFTITPEQLSALQKQQQQQQQQHQDSLHQKVNIDLTSSADDRSSVGSSSSSMEVHEDLSQSENTQPLSGGTDSVEEHFARALGDQWHAVKAANHKISA